MNRVCKLWLRPSARFFGVWALMAGAMATIGAGQLWANGTASGQAEHPGARVYKQMCADCHGGRGEGVAGKHDEPLVGNRSVVALAKYIARSMPEDKEGTCVGDDATNVAAYIFDAFYSP